MFQTMKELTGDPMRSIRVALSLLEQRWLDWAGSHR